MASESSIASDATVEDAKVDNQTSTETTEWISSEPVVVEGGEGDERLKRNAALIRLLHQWLADESGYDEATWPVVKQAIEEHRLSHRKRFCD